MALWGPNGKLTPDETQNDPPSLGGEFLAVMCMHLHHIEQGDPVSGPTEAELELIFALDGSDLTDLADVRAAVVGMTRAQISAYCYDLELALIAYRTTVGRWEYTADAPFTSPHEITVNGQTIVATGANALALGNDFIAQFEAAVWNNQQYPFPRAAVEGGSLAVYNGNTDFIGSAGALMVEVGQTRQRLVSGPVAQAWMGL